MAMNVNYAFRETYTNLTRNVTLTVASILTVTVSLMILGSTVILQRGASNMTQEWDGGIEFMVYVQPDATAAQIEALQKNLDDNLRVEKAIYVDKDESFKDFQRLFRDRPTMLKSVTKDQLPTKFKVVPKSKDADTVDSLVKYYSNQTGVLEVRAALDVIKQMKTITGFLNTAFWVVSIVLIIASILLILNTVRTAMYARRREIEVMKLVGATNWFIRVPFMVEGLVQGLIGGLLASGAVYGVRRVLERLLTRTQRIALLQNFTVSNGDLILACSLVLGTAIIISVISAALATRRFLDV
jgi:cell division transport system permease protein